MTKDQSRSSYTKRIMELVGNIQKQKEGIASILADTQQVQREINQLSGKLERVFIITDEQIYKVSAQDWWNRCVEICTFPCIVVFLHPGIHLVGWIIVCELNLYLYVM